LDISADVLFQSSKGIPRSTLTPFALKKNQYKIKIFESHSWGPWANEANSHQNSKKEISIRIYLIKELGDSEYKQLLNSKVARQKPKKIYSIFEKSGRWVGIPSLKMHEFNKK